MERKVQGQERRPAKISLWKRARCQTRVKSFTEIDSRQDRPRARPGFVEPIQNGLRKIQNLIERRLSRAETDLAGRNNGIRFQKEE